MQQGDVLLIADDELTDADIDRAARACRRCDRAVGTHAAGGVVDGRAIVVLPVTNMLEEEGTFTNLRGRVQRYLQAKAAPGMARPIWCVLADLLAFVRRGTVATTCRATSSTRMAPRARPSSAA